MGNMCLKYRHALIFPFKSCMCKERTITSIISKFKISDEVQCYDVVLTSTKSIQFSGSHNLDNMKLLAVFYKLCTSNSVVKCSI